ncbi:MAG: hydrogenase maturation nickel metallochaperone HypA [Bacteroidota bacterium]
MHEFSIAMSIIEIAETEARSANSEKILSMELNIGTMAGIEFYALDTAMEMAVKQTLLENTSIKVNKIQAIARCTDCNYEFPINHITDECPKCNCLFSDIISGKELKIKSIVIEE